MAQHEAIEEVPDVAEVGSSEPVVHDGKSGKGIGQVLPKTETGTSDEDNGSGRKGMGGLLGFESLYLRFKPGWIGIRGGWLGPGRRQQPEKSQEDEKEAARSGKPERAAQPRTNQQSRRKRAST